jgi:hypothetical protein
MIFWFLFSLRLQPVSRLHPSGPLGMHALGVPQFHPRPNALNQEAAAICSTSPCVLSNSPIKPVALKACFFSNRPFKLN